MSPETKKFSATAVSDAKDSRFETSLLSRSALIPTVGLGDELNMSEPSYNFSDYPTLLLHNSYD